MSVKNPTPSNEYLKKKNRELEEELRELKDRFNCLEVDHGYTLKELNKKTTDNIKLSTRLDACLYAMVLMQSLIRNPPRQQDTKDSLSLAV